jgi:hypothetical protein
MPNSHTIKEHGSRSPCSLDFEMGSYKFCYPYPLEKIRTVIIVALYFVISSIVFISVSTTFCTDVLYVNYLVTCLGLACIINNYTFTVKYLSYVIFMRKIVPTQ